MKIQSVKLIIIATLLVLTNLSAFSQYIIKEADTQYELYNYTKAVSLYKKAYDKKPSLKAAQRIADIYNRQRNFAEAEKWYAIASADKNAKGDDILRLAKALKNTGKYTEARAQYLHYLQMEKGASGENESMWLQSLDSAVKWSGQPLNIAVSNQKILNSPSSDWGANVYNSTIIFTSDRAGKSLQPVKRPFLKFDGKRVPENEVYGWTGNGYLKVYQQKGQDSASLFPLSLLSAYHVGPACFTSDGKRVCFAATKIDDSISYSKSKVLGGKLGTARIEIFYSEISSQGEWGAILPVPFNRPKEYSVGDPFVSADGRTLYFSSDMPGGKGGTDIYMAQQSADGVWSSPVNLVTINSPGNERTPALGTDGSLYFSSDGWIGLGGLDIFKSHHTGSAYLAPVNLGVPLNSPQDDFAFIPVGTRTGYLSSNRIGGAGQDDIYQWEDKDSKKINLAGVARDKVTNALLDKVTIYLHKPDGSKLTVTSNAKGEFNLPLSASSVFSIKAEKIGYSPLVDSVSTIGIADLNLNKTLYLEPLMVNRAIILENVYYDFNKSDIRPDAANGLDKLVTTMLDNPTVHIHLSSHTDSRGPEKFNYNLSKARAKSAVDYLINKGVAGSRISAEGYGETRLLNKCSDGIKCSEQQHQLNRRTEIKITKL
ncbi:OmpA family protein [Pedobacter jamesrossensis]|uniref:OmpA family protein n=1 Tax=Pedobacter jamesrossensis TaxID=1908238 RepID=A0ABV8NNV5_9SPHI